MPRYFFHSSDSIISRDNEGTELPDILAARGQAIATAGSILRENPDRLWSGQPWRMEVTGERGDLLFRLDFALRQATPED